MIDKYLIVVPIALSFLISLYTLPFWIRKAKQIGLIWEDMNKLSADKVAGSGGIMVVLAFIIGSLIYMGYSVFYLDSQAHLAETLALLLVVLMLAGIGLIDDLLGWQHGGLSRRSRIILVALSSIPLMAMNAGRAEIALPILGIVNLGAIYPLLFIPLGIVGATTTYNFLAGFNGLEAGQGILMLSALAIVAHFTGSSWLSVIALCMVASLLAFLIFNICPARVFPGDALTYAVGGLVALLSILGNFEKIAVFFFIPYICEFVLKARGKLVKQSFGQPMKDGSLGLRYDKLYGLSHVSIAFLKKIGIKPTEKRVVYTIWLFQLIVILIGFIIFRDGIFL